MDPVASSSAQTPDYYVPARKPRRITAFFYWLLPLLFSFLAQATFLPCLCGDADAKLSLAAALDGLYVFRGLVVLFHRRDIVAWAFYALVICSSGFWIGPLNETRIPAVLHDAIFLRF